MSDAYTLADLYRRVSQMIKRGVVHSVQASPPRCKVTFGTDPISGDQHVSSWLLWYSPSDSEMQEWNMPAVGSPVTVISEGGDIRNGVVFAGLITDDQSPAGTSPNQHVTKYSDGAEVTYDSSAHAMTVSTPGGTVTVIAAGGIKLQGDTEVDGNLKVTGKSTVDGDSSVGGNLEATGDITDKGGSAGSLQSFREKYNSHDHEYDDGTTEPPNQKFD